MLRQHSRTSAKASDALVATRSKTTVKTAKERAKAKSKTDLRMPRNGNSDKEMPVFRASTDKPGIFGKKTAKKSKAKSKDKVKFAGKAKTTDKSKTAKANAAKKLVKPGTDTAKDQESRNGRQDRRRR